MLKLLIISLSLTIFSAPAAFAWNNVCPKSKNPPDYCDNVGYDAYTRMGDRWIKYATILGVSWRPKGSIIHNDPIMLAPSDNFYYIIKTSDNDRQFLRLVTEIRVKPPSPSNPKWIDD